MENVQMVSGERIRLLKEFIEQEPNDPFNLYALAMEYFETNPKESLSLLEGLLKNHPDYLPAYYKAAHLYWEAGDAAISEITFVHGISLAEKMKNEKATRELKVAYQNFLFDQ